MNKQERIDTLTNLLESGYCGAAPPAIGYLVEIGYFDAENKKEFLKSQIAIEEKSNGI